MAVNGSRAFEDVIFGAILGVWSLKIESLWAPEASSRGPVAFLLAAATLALALRLLLSVRATRERLMLYGWILVLIALASGAGIWTGLFAREEGVVFGLVFLTWSATALLGDWLAIRLFPRGE